MTFLRQAENTAAEEKLTRAIQQVRDTYRGGLAAFFRDVSESASDGTNQRDLPFRPPLKEEHPNK